MEYYEKRKIIYVYEQGLPFVLEFLLQMLNRITMDLRTELLKFLDYYENVHNDGNWSFDNVVDKYIESQHDGKPLLNKAKQMMLEQQHKIDSYTEYYTERELGVLHGMDRIIKLIDELEAL